MQLSESEKAVFQFSIADGPLTITSLSEAKEILEVMRKGEYHGGPVIFEKVEFIGYDFRNIEHVSFRECIFRRCSFRNMKGVTFYLGYVYHSRMLEDLISIYFDGSTLGDVIFIEAKIGRVNFANVLFGNTCFHECTQRSENVHEDSWIKFRNCRWYGSQDIKFVGCDFYNVDIDSCNETGFVFNDLKCIPKASDIIKKYFETTEEGIIAYKVFNQFYPMPEEWKIEEGATITYLSNRNAYDECGEGINVATLGWIYVNRHSETTTVWKVLIPWEEAVGITVPYNFEGKIRCENIKLLKALTEEEFIESLKTSILTPKEED